MPASPGKACLHKNVVLNGIDKLPPAWIWLRLQLVAEGAEPEMEVMQTMPDRDEGRRNLPSQ